LIKKIFKKFCKKLQENKQTKKIIQNKNLGCQMDIREPNSDFRWKKDIFQIYSLLKKCFKTIIISPIKYKLFY